jgi:hypothetical protein
MKKIHLFALVLLFGILPLSQQALAYGGSGSGGSSSCSEATFTDENPTRDTSVHSLGEFSIVASENTDLSTLLMQVNGEKVTPVITPKRSGDSLLEVKLAQPITAAGRVRITLKATSKDGCASFQPIYVEIKP